MLERVLIFFVGRRPDLHQGEGLIAKSKIVISKSESFLTTREKDHRFNLRASSLLVFHKGLGFF